MLRRLFNIVYLRLSLSIKTVSFIVWTFLSRCCNFMSVNVDCQISRISLYLHWLVGARVSNKRAATIFIFIWSWWNYGLWKIILTTINTVEVNRTYASAQIPGILYWLVHWFRYLRFWVICLIVLVLIHGKTK